LAWTYCDTADVVLIPPSRDALWRPTSQGGGDIRVRLPWWPSPTTQHTIKILKGPRFSGVGAFCLPQRLLGVTNAIIEAHPRVGNIPRFGIRARGYAPHAPSQATCRACLLGPPRRERARDVTTPGDPTRQVRMPHQALAPHVQRRHGPRLGAPVLRGPVRHPGAPAPPATAVCAASARWRATTDARHGAA
jgi:hypothetical protein